MLGARKNTRKHVEKCTSVYTFQRRVFAVQKHRCCLEPPTSMSVLTHPAT